MCLIVAGVAFLSVHMQHDDSVTFMEISPLSHQNHAPSTVCRQHLHTWVLIIRFHLVFSQTHTCIFIFTCTESILYVWLWSALHVSEAALQSLLTLPQSVCLHKVPFTHPKHTCKHAKADTRTRVSKTNWTHTHTHVHVRHTHTLGCGKSLALAASYLSCKFASTGGGYNDNDAKIIWPVNLRYLPCTSCSSIDWPAVS